MTREAAYLCSVAELETDRPFRAELTSALWVAVQAPTSYTPRVREISTDDKLFEAACRPRDHNIWEWCTAAHWNVAAFVASIKNLAKENPAKGRVSRLLFGRVA